MTFAVHSLGVQLHRQGSVSSSRYALRAYIENNSSRFRVNPEERGRGRGQKMSTDNETISPSWRDVLVAVLKQTWLAALLAAALMMWDYSAALIKPAPATLAKDSFLTFSFLMFFGNLWLRAKKQVEDKAELQLIRASVKTVHELLMELQALGLQVPNPAQPEVHVQVPAVADAPVPVPGEQKEEEEDEEEEEGGEEELDRRYVEYIGEPAQVAKVRVLRELPHSPLAALIHVAMAIEGQLRRITGGSVGRESSLPASAVKRLREMSDVDPHTALMVSRFLQLRNVAVHEPNTSKTAMVNAVHMGLKILELLEPLPDGTRR